MNEEKKPFFSDKAKLIPIAGAVLGILLLLFGGLFPAKEKGSAAKREDGYYDVRFYTEMLEEKIASLCTSIAGVREATVFLTLDCGTEYVYAQNEQQSGADNVRTDYLILNRENEEGAVLLMEVYPQIRGVAVVCTGGDSAALQQTIVSLLSASLGIPSNHIQVASS